MSKEKIEDEETSSDELLDPVTEIRKHYWKVTKKGLEINLPDRKPIWEIYPHYSGELKNFVAILPRHIFDGNFLNFQLETESADGELKAKWNTGFQNSNPYLTKKLIKIHFLIEKHCLLPMIGSSEGRVKETLVLGSQEQIARSIEMPEVAEQIYDALQLFVLGFHRLKLEWGKKTSLDFFNLYDFSCFDKSTDIDKIPDFVTDDNCFYLNIKSAYVDILSQLPLKASEYAAVKTYPVESQRWLELVTYWRKNKNRQGSSENSFLIDYKTLCRWMPMTEMNDKNSIIKQLQQIHEPFFKNDWLKAFSIVRQKNKITNWILKYQFAAE